MKKIIQLIVVGLFLINTAYAQRWELVPQIGFHNEVSRDMYYTIKYGFDIGLGGAIKIGKFAVETDAIYSWVEGYSFMNIPVKAKYYIIKGFNVFVGPQFNFYLNKDPFLLIEGGQQLSPNHFLFAVMGGIGYRFQKGYNISFSYNYSITETYIHDRNWNNFYPKNMQSIKITLGRYFKLGR